MKSKRAECIHLICESLGMNDGFGNGVHKALPEFAIAVNHMHSVTAFHYIDRM